MSQIVVLDLMLTSCYFLFLSMLYFAYKTNARNKNESCSLAYVANYFAIMNVVFVEIYLNKSHDEYKEIFGYVKIYLFLSLCVWLSEMTFSCYQAVSEYSLVKNDKNALKLVYLKNKKINKFIYNYMFVWIISSFPVIMLFFTNLILQSYGYKPLSAYYLSLWFTDSMLHKNKYEDEDFIKGFLLCAVPMTIILLGNVIYCWISGNAINGHCKQIEPDDGEDMSNLILMECNEEVNYFYSLYTSHCFFLTGITVIWLLKLICTLVAIFQLNHQAIRYSYQTTSAVYMAQGIFLGVHIVHMASRR